MRRDGWREMRAVDVTSGRRRGAAGSGDAAGATSAADVTPEAAAISSERFVVRHLHRGPPLGSSGGAVAVAGNDAAPTRSDPVIIGTSLRCLAHGPGRALHR